MKNKVIMLLIAVAVSTIVKMGLVASPAATQNWVRNYVSTNYAGGASKEWIREYVSTNSVSPSETANIMTNVTINLTKMGQTACQILLDGGSNSVKRAIDSMNAESAQIIDYIMNNTTDL